MTGRQTLRWEYTSVAVDTWLPLSTQGGVKEALMRFQLSGVGSFRIARSRETGRPTRS